MDLPSLVSVLGNWTHRGNRGIVTGLWSTCGNVGNIVGLQLAPYILEVSNQEWYVLMTLIGISYLAISLAMRLFMIQDPSELDLEQLDEN